MYSNAVADDRQLVVDRRHHRHRCSGKRCRIDRRRCGHRLLLQATPCSCWRSRCCCQFRYRYRSRLPSHQHGQATRGRECCNGSGRSCFFVCHRPDQVAAESAAASCHFPSYRYHAIWSPSALGAATCRRSSALAAGVGRQAQPLLLVGRGLRRPHMGASGRCCVMQPSSAPVQTCRAKEEAPVAPIVQLCCSVHVLHSGTFATTVLLCLRNAGKRALGPNRKSRLRHAEMHL
jgi:hypothetical protein